MRTSKSISGGNDFIVLTIGGRQHNEWVTYSIDSDLQTPADAWHLQVAIESGKMPEVVKRGAPVTLRIGDDLVLTGRLDGFKDRVSKRSHTLTLSGRDSAAALVDCSAQIFAAQMLSLEDIAAKIVKPLGITKIRIDAVNARMREKVNVEPCDTAWQALQNAAEANGLWPWMEPDGTLVIGGPDYDLPPVATLVLRFDGKGNNVEELERNDEVARSYSEVTVLSQTHTTSTHSARPNVRAVYKDEAVTWYRPLIVVDHEVETTQQAKDRAHKIMQDSRLKGFSLTASVMGHRIDAPGEAGDGLLWQAGQRVRVVSESHEIDDVFFLMGRNFSGGRNQPTLTRLTLKEDAMWIIEAHPHKRRHRRGRNGIGIGQIIDLTGS